MIRHAALLFLGATTLAVIGLGEPAEGGHLSPSAQSEAGGENDPAYPGGCDTTDPAQCCDGPPEECCGNGAGSTSGGGSTGASNGTAGGSTRPVSAVNGREVLVRTDMVVPGVYPIRLTRRYDSQSTYDSPLGYGWAWAFDLRLFEYPDGSVVIRNSCGYKHRFSPGALEPEVGRQEELVATASGHTLTYARGSKAKFDLNGRLEALETAVGNRLEFDYESGGKHPLIGTSPFSVDPTLPLEVARVDRVSQIREVLAEGGGTPTGRSVSFVYDANGRLDSATAHDLRQVTYEHEAAGVGQTSGNLTVVYGLEGIDETYGYEPSKDHNLTRIQLGQGTTPWTIEYDGEDRVKVQRRGIENDPQWPVDRVITFDYATPLTTVVSREIRNSNGDLVDTATELFTYDTRGYLTLRVDELGNEFQYDRDASGFLDVATVRRNTGTSLEVQKTIEFDYSLDGDLEERRTLDPQSAEVITERWTYDRHWVTSYELVSSQHSARFGTVYELNHNGGVPTSIDKVHQLRETDPADTFETTEYAYDANGQLERIIPPEVSPADGLQFVFEYFGDADDRYGLLRRMYLETGGVESPYRQFTFDYDDRGFLVSESNALGDARKYAWDDLGRLLSFENPKGEVSSVDYRGPSMPGSYAAAPPGHFLSRVEAGTTAAEGEGQVQRLRWDVSGRLALVERKDDQGVWLTFASYAYDSDDNRVEVEDGELQKTTFAYNAAGWLVSLTDAAPSTLGGPNTTLYAYDALGNRIRAEDAANHVTEYEWDARDRLREVRQLSEGLTTEFEYDASGSTVVVRDPRQVGTASATTYTYDGLSRLTSVRRPSGKAVSYTYDERGRLAERTNARGHVARQSFFAWGGVEQVDYYPDATTQVSDRTVSFTYDLAGRMRSTSDSALVTSALAGAPPEEEPAGRLYTFSRDALGRVERSVAHFIPPGDREIVSGFDRFGNRSGLTFVDTTEALASSVTFDDLDRPSLVSGLGGLDIVLNYRGDDKLLSSVRPSGVETHYDYYQHGPVKEIRVEDGQGADLLRLTYTPDEVLNLATASEERSGQPALDYVYGYDGVGRLTSSSYPVSLGLPGPETFEYDDAGNREEPGAVVPNIDDEVASAGGLSWAYDDDGNLARRDIGLPTEERFTFSQEGRLVRYESDATSVEYPSGVDATYFYDAFGRRLRKTVNGVDTWFIWDGDQLLAEFDASGTRTRRYNYATGLVPIEVAVGATSTSENVSEVHSDAVGAPRMVVDSGGLVVWRASYTAFGSAAESGSFVLDQRLLGQHLDRESSLHYNRWRYYDPESGIYLSRDPFGQLGDLNVFRFANSSPTVYTDPDGRLLQAIGLALATPQGQVLTAAVVAAFGWAAANTWNALFGSPTGPSNSILTPLPAANPLGGLICLQAPGKKDPPAPPPQPPPQTPGDQGAPDAKAPGRPTAKDGFKPPRNWNGNPVKNPNGPGKGYPAKDGKVWVPTGPGPTAHGGPHWDVQDPVTGGHTNVYPGGKVR